MLKKLKKITVAVVIENFLYGGTTTQLINLINSRSFKGIKFQIITNKNNSAIKQLKSSCNLKNIKLITYTSLNVIQSDIMLLKILFFIFRPILFLISILQMYLILKKINFNLLLADCGGYGDFRSEMASVLAARILNHKNIYLLIHHCYTKPRLWSNLIDSFNKLIGKYVKGTIFVSKATKESIKKNTKLLEHQRKIKIIYNGVSLKKIKKNKIYSLKVKRGISKIGMLSRIEEYKGQLDLIEAFSKLPDTQKLKFKVFFIGDGKSDFVNMINEKIKFLKLENYFRIIKYINKDSLIILKNLNIVVSLTRDFEGFGYSLAEALYARVPVISTNVGGTRELLNKTVANLVKPKDIKSVTNLLKDFIINRKSWNIKANLGRERIAKKFNSELMARKFFEELILRTRLI